MITDIYEYVQFGAVEVKVDFGPWRRFGQYRKQNSMGCFFWHIIGGLILFLICYFNLFMHLLFDYPSCHPCFCVLQVNFMITDSTVTNRRLRRSDRTQARTMAASDAQVYVDLAQASGGLAIEVTKSELPAATSIITESSSSSLVQWHNHLTDDR